MAINPLSVPNFGGPYSGGADFSPLANLGNVMQAQQDRQRQLAALGQLGTDPTQNAMTLIKSNDPRLAQTGLELMQNITRQKYLESQQAESQREFALTNKLAQEKEARAQRAEDYDSEEGRTNRLVEAQKTNPNLPGPNSPEGQYFIHSGNWPDPTKQNKVLTEKEQRDEREKWALEHGYPKEEASYFAATQQLPGQKPLTGEEQKLADAADARAGLAQDVLANIKEMRTASKDAWSGWKSHLAGPVESTLADVPFAGDLTPKGVIATEKLKQLAGLNVVDQYRTAFGSRGNMKEFQLLKQIESTPGMSDRARQALFDQLEPLMERRLQQAQEEARGIRGKTYFKPGGEPSVVKNNETQAPPERTPKPTEASKVSAGDVSIEDIMREKARRRQAGNK